MRIYVPSRRPGFEFCYPVSDEAFEDINISINGVERARGWQPIAVSLVHEDDGVQLMESDSPWLGEHALIFRTRSIEVLGGCLRQFGELLPLECDEAKLFMFNPTRLINALDEDRSVADRLPDGRIVEIERYSFVANLVRGVDAFKITSLRVSPTFVSERVVESWNAAGLRGLNFKLVSEV